jgi:hypothetical protein
MAVPFSLSCNPNRVRRHGRAIFLVLQSKGSHSHRLAVARNTKHRAGELPVLNLRFNHTIETGQAVGVKTDRGRISDLGGSGRNCDGGKIRAQRNGAQSGDNSGSGSSRHVD